MKFTIEELRPLDIFEGLPEQSLEWISDHGIKIELATDEHMFEHGQPAEFLFIVISGTIHRYDDIGGQWLVVATTKRGQVTGMLPFSRMLHYPGPAVAAEQSVLCRINKKDFSDLVVKNHELGQRLVAEMSNRVRHDIRREQQKEKLVSLGRLSAGLAHELNNPAAAIRRTTSNLAERLTGNAMLVNKLLRQSPGKSSIDILEKLLQISRNRVMVNLSPLERSEGEEKFSDWLENHGLEDDYNLSALCTDAGLLVTDLNPLEEIIPPKLLGDALAWVAGTIEVERMLTEITSSASRISELVSSVKTYSHMDQSTEHKPTSVREGLDNTLTMFGHKLGVKKIRLSRDYGDDIPLIKGYAGELNQVWTILIENAIDAMAENGQLSIEIGKNDFGIIVKIIDDGDGIPEDICHRIFDPFFTTKGVGEGMGLGLDIARRIVHMHRGQINVQSEAGRTEMSVELPHSSTTR